VKLIIGLGNPGIRYRFHRHNVGFLIVDQMALQHHIPITQTLFDAHIGKGKIDSSAILLAQPQTFMNQSGIAVRKLAEYYRTGIEDIIVIHDDLDLPFQTIRLKAGGGHGGHKGLMSIIEHLSAADFLRVRFGIGRPERKSMVEDYVLSPFSQEEATCLPRLLDFAAEAATDIVSSDIQAAMERYHRREHPTLIEED
jgi:peptidyl-tRNA hydrolase, PTH1 family